MIDYFALALGHGLLAIALLRLVMRDGLDADPLIEQLKADTKGNRTAISTAGRNAKRRAHLKSAGNADSDAESPDRAETI